MSYNIKDFKKGDTVQLKSNDLLMTVKDTVWIEDEVICTWFDKDGKKRKGRFNKDLLIKK